MPALSGLLTQSLPFPTYFLLLDFFCIPSFCSLPEPFLPHDFLFEGSTLPLVNLPLLQPRPVITQLPPRSFSYRRLPVWGMTVTKLQRAYKIYQRRTTTTKKSFPRKAVLLTRAQPGYLQLTDIDHYLPGDSTADWPGMVNSRSGWAQGSQI